jgi:uncharacterized protein
VARLALDIDSTLHPYWDILERVALERFGVQLSYADQHDWGITALAPGELVHCVEETHSEANIATATPYPDAVETVRRWHDEGHWIHVTSHRRTSTATVTADWLEAIGMPYHDLHCSFDKVPRCVELKIDVLIDDSPVNIAQAREQGMLAATLIHPWNRRLIEQPGVIGGRDWRELAARLDPVLADLGGEAR